MLSKEAKKSQRKYRALGYTVNWFYWDPHNVSKYKLKLQRIIFDMVGKYNPKVKGTSKEEVTLNGIKTWKVSTPNSDPNKILLYFHGGAYIVGSPQGYYSMMSYLADTTGTTVYIPDYRLGPENRFPSQLEDGVSTYKALIEDLNYKPTQVAIGGDSAGGNLTLATLLKLKELNVPMPVASICLSPWTDPAATGESYNEEMAEKDVILGPIFKKMWSHGIRNFHAYYVDDSDMDEKNPLINPIHGDFSGCPPMMVQVSTDELLLSDSRSIKETLEKSGCEYEYYEWEGLWHVFHLEVGMPETIKSFKMYGEFLNKHYKVTV